MRLGPLLILAWSGLTLVGLIAAIMFGFSRGAAFGVLMFVGGLLSGGLLLAWIGAMEQPGFVGSAMFIAEIVIGLIGMTCFVAGAVMLGRDRQQ